MKTIILYILLLIGYNNLTYSQASSITENLQTDSLMNKLLTGNDDISIILGLYEINQDLTEDSLLILLNISNQNYLNNDNSRKAEPDLKFRYIFFSDQYYRIKCYYHKQIEYDVVIRNDSILQSLFLAVVNEHSNLHIFTNSIFQMTYSLLLIHSVSSNIGFFENNFHKYASPFSNNFKNNNSLKAYIDLYLKFKYNKQYFGTEYGKGRISDGTFGLLPKISDNEFIELLSYLKVYDAIY